MGDAASIEAQQEALLRSKYGGIKPKKKLISQGHGQKYFDSGDWVLQKQEQKVPVPGSTRLAAASGPTGVGGKGGAAPEPDRDALQPVTTTRSSSGTDERSKSPLSKESNQLMTDLPEDSFFQSPMKELLHGTFHGLSSSNVAVVGLYTLYQKLTSPQAELSAPERENLALTMAECLFFEGKCATFMSPSPCLPREHAVVDFVRRLHDQKGSAADAGVEEMKAAGFSQSQITEVVSWYGMFNFPVPPVPEGSEPFDAMRCIANALAGSEGPAKAAKAESPPSPKAAPDEGAGQSAPSGSAAIDANPMLSRLRHMG